MSTNTKQLMMVKGIVGNSLMPRERSLQILRLINKNGPMPQSSIVEKLQLKPASIHAHFQKLKQQVHDIN